MSSLLPELATTLPNDRSPLLSEDFEGDFQAAGWTTEDATGECPWLTSDDYAMPGLTGNTRGAAVDSDACGSGTVADASLITPEVDLSGVTDAVLVFDFAYRHFGSSSTAVDVSTDGGSTWTTLQSWSATFAYPAAPAPVEIDLSAYDGQNSVTLRWRYQSGYDYWAFVDNVVVTSAGDVPTPEIAVSPNAFDVSAEQGEDVTRTLTVSNTGTASLDYSLGFRPDVERSARPAVQSFTYMKQGQQLTGSTAVLEGSGVSERRALEDGHLSFEASEGFTLGFIGGQQGWSTITNNTLQPTITDAQSSDGDWSLALSRHDGLNNGANVAAFSPEFLYSNDVIHMSFDIMVEATGGSDYQVLAQAPSQGSVAIRMNFNYLGNLMILDEVDGAVAYQNVGPYDAGVWNTVDVEMNKLDGTISYSLNGELVHEGVIYGADAVEQFVFLHDNWNDGENGYVDNVHIEGENSWLALDSSGGTLAPGESDDITLTFDTSFGLGAFGRDLASYAGEIVVLSNDPENPEVTVPVSFTITDDAGDDTEMLAYWAFNDGGDNPEAWPPPIDSDEGDGSITHNFTVAGTAGHSSFGGSPINALPDYGSGGSFVPQGEHNNGNYFTISTSTLGYEDLQISYATQRTGTGFTAQEFAYSVDGGSTFTPFETVTDIPGSFELREVLLPSEAEQQAQLLVRVTLTGATSGSGNNRFDNLLIMGNEAEPPTGDGPQASFNPPIETGLEVTANSGETVEGTFTITNTGSETLEYVFTQYDDGSSDDLANPANPLANRMHLFPRNTEKGSNPNTPTHLPLRGEGGPDNFGYTWIDSNEPGGPAFESIDITDTGSVVTLIDTPGCTFAAPDEGTAMIDLPFDFPFYGDSFGEVYVNANGFLAMQPVEGGCAFTSRPFPNEINPNATSPGGMIAPLWADLHGYTVGSILTEQLADGRFVIQFNDWRRFGQEATSNLTFQVILSPSGVIRYQYLTVEGSFVAGTNVGIQSPDTTDGLTVATGPGYAAEGLAVVISASPAFVDDVTPTSGTIAPGSSETITVTFNAEGLLEGQYSGTLNIETNDEVGAYDYPVTLNVIGTAGPVVTPTTLAFGNVIVGFDDTLEAGITNTGTAGFTITGVSIDNDDFETDLEAGITLAPGASADFEVTFTPSTVGTITGTLTIETDGGDVEVALSGVGQAPPQASADPSQLTFSVEMDQTSSQTFTLSNLASSGAADLDYSISVVQARPAGTVAASQGAYPETLSPNTPLDLASLGFQAVPGMPEISQVRGGVDCEAEPGIVIQDDGTAENGYSGNPAVVQSVTLVDRYTPTEYPATVSAVCLSFITLAGGPSTLNFEVQVFAADGPGGAPGTLLGTVPATATNIPAIPQGSPIPVVFQTVDVSELELSVESGSIYVGARWVPPSGTNVFLASDQSTDRPVGFAGGYFGTVPAAGGAIEWQTTQAAYPAYRALMVRPVIGLAQQVVAVDPTSGMIAPGDSDEITVTVDATDLEPGVYEYEILIATNDPANPVVTVDVTLTVLVDSEDGATPVVFALAQNYPNPFARNTTVEFALPQSVPVTLEVFDVTGRRVATLVDREMEAGTHRVTWEANGLASGTYLYRIQAGSFSQTLRAQVIR